MPRKTDDTKNAAMSFSLPAGARTLLQELVDLQLVGGGQSEVIRHLVVTGLMGFVERGHIGRGKKGGSQHD
jgi:hypothetical protein